MKNKFTKFFPKKIFFSMFGFFKQENSFFKGIIPRGNPLELKLAMTSVESENKREPYFAQTSR